METHQHAHEQHHHDQHDADGSDRTAALAEILDLDAEVFHTFLPDVTALVHEFAGDLPVRRILDLGCGTGVGTFALLKRFEQAEAFTLDASEPMLRHLTDRARTLGVADRVHPVQADLDGAWLPADTLGTVDLVWASVSLHHVADPDRVLGEVLGALRPGGVLAVAEMDSFPRFLPDDLGLGRPGLEERCHAAQAQRHALDVPHLGDDWRERLARAGFTIEAERPFVIALTPPLSASAGRYAQASLRRVRSHLDGQLSGDDLAVLDTLLDSEGPENVLRRDDLSIRTTRTVWVARRP
jgi:SAM-dependent methyltransferase